MKSWIPDCPRRGWIPDCPRRGTSIGQLRIISKRFMTFIIICFVKSHNFYASCITDKFLYLRSTDVIVTNENLTSISASMASQWYHGNNESQTYLLNLDQILFNDSSTEFSFSILLNTIQGDRTLIYEATKSSNYTRFVF